MLQQPEQGGEFQFTKPFRNEDNEEETYEVADSVLAGDKDHVNTLEFHPGKVLLKIQDALEFDLLYRNPEYFPRQKVSPFCHRV